MPPGGVTGHGGIVAQPDLSVRGVRYGRPCQEDRDFGALLST